MEPWSSIFHIEITEKRLDLQYINNYVAWQAFI